MEDAGVKLIAQNANVYIGDLKDATNATNSFVDSTEKGGGRVSAAGQVMIGALRKVGSVAVEAFGQALKASAAFIGDSISLAGDFEQGMLDFQAAAGKDVDAQGLEQFRDLFIDIGKRLPVSTTAVEKAATEMVKGGIDPAIVAAGGLEQNIQFAAAAMDGDLVAAAETSAKLLGGWVSVTATAAEKVDFLTHSTDLLTKAANASSVNVLELRSGIFNAQGVAKTAGVEFDDLTVALAELAPRFASSSEAGNSLKNMIARLQPTTQPAIDAFQALGLITEDGGNKFYDAQGKFVGFKQASQILQEALKGLTQQQQAAVLQTMFGNDAMGSAAAFAELGAAGYQHMSDAMASANGVSENAALKQQGFNTALENTKGSIEAMQIQLGSYLLPLLGDLLDNYITPAINAFSDWASAILGADDPLLALVQSVDALAPGLGSIIGYITTLVTEGDSLNDFLASTPPLFQGVVSVARTLADLIGDDLTPILFGIGTAITVAVVPALVSATGAFLAAAAPVVALVAAGALLYKAWETDFLGIKTMVTAFWNDTLLPAFKDMQAWMAEKIPPAIKTLSDFWTGTLQPALKDVWSFLQNKVFPVLSDLADVFIAAAIIEVKALAALWSDVLQPALKVVWDFISGSVIPIFKALFEVNWAIATKAVEALAGLWEKVLQPAFAAVGDYINETVVPAFKSIGDYLSQTFGPILADAKKWLSDITGGFQGVSGGVEGVVKWLGDLATSISNLKLPDWLTPGSPTPWEIALYGIGKALSTSVAPGLRDMRAGVVEIGEQIEDSFADTDLVDMLASLGQDAMEGFGEGLLAGLDGVMDVINSTADTVEGAFRDAFDANSPARRMVPAGQFIIQGVMQGMSEMLPGLTDLVGGISSDLIDEMEDIGSQMQNAIADSFGATASIDRQIAKNLDSFKDVLPQYEQYTSGALQEAQSQAESFLDPAQGAKYFQMKSKQILEYAKLQKQLAEAESQDDKDRIAQQMLLINRAQQAEISQFNAIPQQNPMQQMADQINAVMMALSGIDLTDEQIHIVDMLAGMWSGLQQTGPTRAQQYANPPMMQYPTSGPTTSNRTTNVNMPIYTNNTPGAIQQSWAIVQASMP